MVLNLQDHTLLELILHHFQPIELNNYILLVNI